MQEYNIEIEIDEDGNLVAETKGFNGETCVNELDTILKGLEGDRSNKYKPEYYQKNSKLQNTIKSKS